MFGTCYEHKGVTGRSFLQMGSSLNYRPLSDPKYSNYGTLIKGAPKVTLSWNYRNPVHIYQSLAESASKP